MVFRSLFFFFTTEKYTWGVIRGGGRHKDRVKSVAPVRVHSGPEIKSYLAPWFNQIKHSEEGTQKFSKVQVFIGIVSWTLLVGCLKNLISRGFLISKLSGV